MFHFSLRIFFHPHLKKEVILQKTNNRVSEMLAISAIFVMVVVDSGSKITTKKYRLVYNKSNTLILLS